MRLSEMYIESGGPGSGCRGPNCGRPPGAAHAKIQKSKIPLSPLQTKMETRARAQAARHPDRMIADYRQRFGNILNADNAKELFQDYVKNRTDGAAAVHESASELMKRMFAGDLATPAPPGKENMVLFTAGGAGTGKTSAVNHSLHDAQEKAQIVFDGTLRPANKAIAKIEQTLKAGKSARIVFVHREAEDAFVHGVLDRATNQEKLLGSGRTVPLSEFVAQHTSVLAAMREIEAKYKGDSRVQMDVIDNTHGHFKSQLSNLERLPEPPSKEALTGTLLAALEKEHDEGRISNRIYKATKGAGGTTEVGM